MRRLADFRGLFDDEKEEEFFAEEEAEGKETDEEEGSPLVREGSLPPPTADPPLPAGNPLADVVPPPPSTPGDASSEGQHASTEVVPTTGVKRAREGMNEPSADLLRVTKRRTEEAPIESRAGSGEPVVVGDQAAGLGSEEAGRSAMDADPSQTDEEGVKSPLVEEHRDQAVGLGSDEAVRAAADVDPSKQDDEEDDGLVAYKRTRLNFSYEQLLVEEKSSAQARFVAIEKERDTALAKVKELEASLALAKKGGKSRKLKKQLDKAEAESSRRG
ncbi:unnamed protein product [Cochlearia groenlandica]